MPENWKSVSCNQFQAVLNFVWASSTTLMQVRMVSAALQGSENQSLGFSFIALFFCRISLLGKTIVLCIIIMDPLIIWLIKSNSRSSVFAKLTHVWFFFFFFKLNWMYKNQIVPGDCSPCGLFILAWQEWDTGQSGPRLRNPELWPWKNYLNARLGQFVLLGNSKADPKNPFFFFQKSGFLKLGLHS